MPRIRYINKRFSNETLAIIERANEICNEYSTQGYDLTLRQLYYQFVARGYIPNSQQSYARLGNIVNDARMAGLLDWDYIVDRTRNLRGLRHWNDPAHAIKDAHSNFRIEKWKDQPIHVEVWIEKDALVGVLEAACVPEDVDFFSCRGYTSQSEAWGAAQRIREYITAGKKVVVLHLGDHDPSGVDMTRDIRERLFLFLATDLFRDGLSEPNAIETAKSHLEVRRIALTMRQVEQLNPPPNPAKFTDSRYKAYVDRYGRECWELDALPPDVLVGLIRRSIERLRHAGKWDAAVERERKHKELLAQVSERWGDVVDFLDGVA
jgi:hypothetical protein